MTMNRVEKAFTIFYWTYLVIYLCCFIGVGVSGNFPQHFYTIMPFHIFGMVIGIPMLIILFRDLYKREFPNPNTKVTWTILFLQFWPSIPVYLYKHGFRPRGCPSDSR